jgi:thiamine biosynthesis lipoprotein
MTAQILRRQFKGLGTSIDLRVWPDEGREQIAAGSLARAVQFLREAEARLSRFRPDSELSRLNRGSPRARRVSRLTFAVIRAAVAAARATDGLFDPTILQALLSAGYDRSFDELRGDAAQAPACSPGSGDASLSPRLERASPNHPAHSQAAGVRSQASCCGRWQEIELDAAKHSVWLPPGVGIDLGGIAKGWLADRVLRGLQRSGAAYVDLGGDIAFSAPPQGSNDWQVEIEDPRAAESIVAVMRVQGGGVATSGVTRRTWISGSERRHHLIDPRSGKPADTDLLSVTIAAPATAAAEVAAKTVLLLGTVAGVRALEQSDDLAGVLIPSAGEPILAGECSGRGVVLERA